MAEYTLTDKTKAAIDMMRRCGASRVDFRYSGSGEPDDCDPPLIWTVVAVTTVGPRAGAAASFETAVMNCAEDVVDMSVCAHCGRPSALDADEDDTINQLMTHGQICWYMYDPELRTFRRSCEGETTKRAVCGWSWHSLDDADHRHVCLSPGTHPMEHRCICGALYPS